jgi:succinate dehydrogenase (ubiquinone) cytochrome b560 subunit
MTKNISPHVSIYKFPVTAISSILTRVSGVYLSGLFIAGGISKLVNKDKYLYDKYNNLNSNLKTAFHYTIIFPSVYHTYGGLRHFIWDKYPKLLTNKSVPKSSYLLFGLTGLSSILAEKLINKK